MNYIVKSGQSIYDIAVEVYGGVAGIKNILIDNPTIDINTYLEENSTLIVFPNTSTIVDINISNYFKYKTITGVESLSEIESIDSIASYGELKTNSLGGDTYINSMWGNNSVNLSNTGVLLDELNFDRIHLSAPIVLDSNGGFFEIEFVYNDLGIDQYLFGSEFGSSIRIINNRISLYSSGERFEIENSTTLVDGNRYRLGGSIASAQTNNPLENFFTLSVDGVSETSPTTSFGEVNLSLVGGEDGSRGYEGNISYLNINGSIFDFLKGSGIYIYRTR
tara:strand:- start:563 stop:1396 length:834 start_codon:yes stop_codon:yes gene_type:complete